MKALLLRVGIDKGTDRSLAPIFEDGSFEYIPMSEKSKSKETKTYGTKIGRSKRPLSYYLPQRLAENIIHFDPEFCTFTYGDPTIKRRYLLKLDRDDLLVFYAGLTPFNNNVFPEALYLIGYFTVEERVDFNKLSLEEQKRCVMKYNNNAHIKRSKSFKDLVIVSGSKSFSKLLDKAILISEVKYGKNDFPYQAVSKEMESLLGIFGSIFRSMPPRFIYKEDKIENLKKLLGIPM